jgi:hypothetical protein
MPLRFALSSFGYDGTIALSKGLYRYILPHSRPFDNPKFFGQACYFAITHHFDGFLTLVGMPSSSSTGRRLVGVSREAGL